MARSSWLLLSDAIVRLVVIIGQQFAYRSYMHRYKPTTTMLVAERWNSLLTSAVEIALYLISAYLLARWLYGTGKDNESGDRAASKS